MHEKTESDNRSPFCFVQKVPCDYRLPVLNEKDRQYSDITKVRMASKSGSVMVE